ncbi:MAG: ChuX/HutX family heme-like substrate-binding protein [Pigmentiphaga sp.]|uniref:hemin-degrading factor n=1 Tax=Pigmentiphaga sp. TaxID=1977564 RepID=UPI0029AF2EB4|nr:ChuX/HutX family heme-like substrate-binding protein [Pigmentiphaga sp.]MDX3905094.1 ChuX/HutX family heme-like substrate-binding protein [Pigmentiphaga sp.]
MTTSSLWHRYLALKAEQPKLRMRDAAARLGASEGELVAADPAATRLKTEWAALLGGLKAAGPLLALTRNEAAVHEKTGVYEHVQIEGKMGLALNPNIDLRLFLSQWRHAFAVGGERPSMQVFDQQGEAVHKIYVVEDTDRAAFEALLAAHADVPRPVAPEPRPSPEHKADEEVDIDAFRQQWRELRDTHEFFGLLRRHGLGRVQALRLAPPEFARQVGIGAVDAVLGAAAESGLPIMVFVGNAGCVQIHTGPVHRIAPMGPWLNVLDPGFNLHLRMDLCREAWLVRKPTSDGIVTSLECYDADGALIVQFFGERKPGKPELPPWTALADSLADIAPGTPRPSAA